MDSLYDDIFSAQSNTANNKRNYEPEEEDQTKFKNIQPEYNEENDEDELDKMTMEERLELMDQADVFKTTETGLKMMIRSVEKAVTKNTEDRIKYPDDPLKFEESECELHKQLKKSSTFSTTPHLYPLLVKLGFIRTLNELLNHANSLISIDALDILIDLTDMETYNQHEEADLIFDAIVQNNILDTIIENIPRLNESFFSLTDKEMIQVPIILDEDEGIHKSFTVIQNVFEVRPSIYEHIFKETSFFTYLMKFIQVKEFCSLKLFASELLSMCLQQSEGPTFFMKLNNAFKKLLEAIAVWKKNDPQSSEECECVENLYNCLCSLLMVPSVRISFYELEGVHLLLLPISKCNYSRVPAFKALDYALQEYKPNCDVFLDNKGLKFLFPAFLGKHNSHRFRRQDQEDKQSFQTTLLNIFHTLLTIYKPEEINFKRVVKKFEENNYEKCDYLLKLYLDYKQKNDELEQQFIEGKLTLTEEDKEFGTTIDDFYEDKRYSNGYYVYEACALCIHSLMQNSAMKQHIQKVAYDQQWSIEDVNLVIELKEEEKKQYETPEASEQ